MSAGAVYPLTWPAGWKRTPAESRSVGRFGTTKTNVMNGWRHTEHISIHAATVRLRQELGRMGVHDDDIVLPPPQQPSAGPRTWRDVFGSAVTNRAQLAEVYRRPAAAHHPDRGGDLAKMAELNAARDAAMGELR